MIVGSLRARAASDLWDRRGQERWAATWRSGRAESTAGRGRCRPPCRERFRPRAVGIADARCVGREARTAASSGKGRMVHDDDLQREIDLAEQRRRNAETDRHEGGSQDRPQAPSRPL